MNNRKKFTKKELLKLRDMRIVKCMSIDVMIIKEKRQKKRKIMIVKKS